MHYNHRKPTVKFLQDSDFMGSNCCCCCAPKPGHSLIAKQTLLAKDGRPFKGNECRVVVALDLLALIEERCPNWRHPRSDPWEETALRIVPAGANFRPDGRSVTRSSEHFRAKHDLRVYLQLSGLQLADSFLFDERHLDCLIQGLRLNDPRHQPRTQTAEDHTSAATPLIPTVVQKTDSAPPAYAQVALL